MKYKSTALVFLFVWGVIVFYIATAVFDGLAASMGFYQPGIIESARVVNGD